MAKKNGWSNGWADVKKRTAAHLKAVRDQRKADRNRLKNS